MDSQKQDELHNRTADDPSYTINLPANTGAINRNIVKMMETRPLTSSELDAHHTRQSASPAALNRAREVLTASAASRDFVRSVGDDIIIQVPSATGELALTGSPMFGQSMQISIPKTPDLIGFSWQRHLMSPRYHWSNTRYQRIPDMDINEVEQFLSIIDDENIPNRQAWKCSFEYRYAVLKCPHYLAPTPGLTPEMINAMGKTGFVSCVPIHYRQFLRVINIWKSIESGESTDMNVNEFIANMMNSEYWNNEAGLYALGYGQKIFESGIPYRVILEVIQMKHEINATLIETSRWTTELRCEWIRLKRAHLKM